VNNSSAALPEPTILGKMLHREWSMDIDAAIDEEAQIQAQLMESNDFRRAYDAFAAKRRPAFEGD